MKHAIGDSVRALLASFLDYVELRLRLVGVETQEAALHLFTVVLLVVTTLVCLAGFLLLLIVFVLYLMVLILPLQWGWCALILAAGLLLISVVTGILFRVRLPKTLFPITLAEFVKDRQWLKHSPPSSV
jgi:uncharacterized membrane protein YqjE